MRTGKGTEKLYTVKKTSVFVAEKLTDLLYPPRCPVCAALLPPLPDLRSECAWNDLVCGNCAMDLPWLREPLCKKCGRPLEESRTEEEFCAECTSRKRLYREGKGIFAYRGQLRESVLSMKFQNKREWLDFFSAAMAQSADRYLKRTGVRTIIPVPSSRAKKRRRGYDQSVLLARKLSVRTKIPVCEGNLIRIRDTQAQSGLGMRQRRENLKDAFVLKDSGIVSEPVLLTDDIFTTGSTLEECCGALRRAGITQICFLVLCMA